MIFQNKDQKYKSDCSIFSTLNNIEINCWIIATYEEVEKIKPILIEKGLLTVSWSDTGAKWKDAMKFLWDYYSKKYSLTFNSFNKGMWKGIVYKNSVIVGIRVNRSFLLDMKDNNSLDQIDYKSYAGDDFHHFLNVFGNTCLDNSENRFFAINPKEFFEDISPYGIWFFEKKNG